jgi:hypothetical protein
MIQFRRFLVDRVRQQQNGAAEKQGVEEKFSAPRLWVRRGASAGKSTELSAES